MNQVCIFEVSKNLKRKFLKNLLANNFNDEMFFTLDMGLGSTIILNDDIKHTYITRTLHFPISLNFLFSISTYKTQNQNPIYLKKMKSQHPPSSRILTQLPYIIASCIPLLPFQETSPDPLYIFSETPPLSSLPCSPLPLHRGIEASFRN